MLALTAAYAPFIHLAGDDPDWNPWRVPRRRLAEYLLSLSLVGDGYVVIGGRTTLVRAGQSWLLPPGSLADIGSKRGNHPVWVSFDVMFHPRRTQAPKAYAHEAELGRRRAWLQPNPQQVWGVELPLLLPAEFSQRVATILPALVRRWRQGTPLAVLEATHQLSGILLDLVRTCGKEPAARAISTTAERIAAAEAEMRARLHEGVGLNEFAQAADMGRTAFCAAYKQLKGCAPGRFLAETRMQMAELLLAAGTPVSDVAKQAGYSDATSFGRMFRRTRGCTPSSASG